MVCPNCHSDKIIQVQDQLFCINCGQQVPESAKKPGKPAAKMAIQDNGLPQGVTVLPVTTPPKPEAKATKVSVAEPSPEPAAADDSGAVTIKPRKRMGGTETAAAAAGKRKPGR